MRIADVLRGKGTEVVSVERDTSVWQLLALLAEHNIGAVVVRDGDAVAGIVSERDIVRRLQSGGVDILAGPVSAIMTELVVTCAPEDSVDSLTAIMTERRVRHLPVMVDGRLAGIVSIGDVVKSRVAQLEQDREQLESYIAQG
ncbi:CBS domain protein [Tamaricihabitans halophyticus]|uniref:CBS domain protein n=1 Tax=Tamaricihabitans halophyticus TaxID=1262583 RepID=A0A4R2R3B5_9PSEU|nr:CBS domain-containing protein [Tamaricihabitans halophyticus]TCP57302.1 CBS domain protein [Tamaricihabitans halophyticus]